MMLGRDDDVQGVPGGLAGPVWLQHWPLNQVLVPNHQSLGHPVILESQPIKILEMLGKCQNPTGYLTQCRVARQRKRGRSEVRGTAAAAETAKSMSSVDQASLLSRF